MMVARKAYMRPAALFLLGLALTFYAWWPDVASFAYLAWNVDIYSHSWMVPLVSAWLVWRRWPQLSAQAPQPWAWGVLVLLAGTGLWLGGMLLDAQLPRHVALVVMVQGLVLSLFGPRLYRTILFAMLFLFLAVPFGQDLVPPLQLITARLVIRMLDLIGVPFTADGVMITLSSGIYEVAQACAGVKFLFTSLVMSVLMAHLAFKSWRRRVLMLAAGLLVPILANALRVLGILLIAEATDQSFAKGIDHIVYGWVFLSAVLLILISLAYRFADRSATDDTAVPPGGKGRAAPVALVAPMLLLPLFARILMPPVDPAIQCAVADIPVPVCADCGFRILDDTYVPVWPHFSGADREDRALYRNAGTRLQLYRALYSPERPGHRLTNADNRLMGDPWQILPGPGRGTFERDGLVWQETVMRDGGARRLVWALYMVDGHAVQPGRSGKLRAALSRLGHGFNRAGVLILASEIVDTPETARLELGTFLSTFPVDTLLWNELFKPDGEPICVASAG